ncbi:MAG: UDP-N-acetylmuramoyl-L-alanine--D-glutamate ligase [Chloroflexota bacterium]
MQKTELRGKRVSVIGLAREGTDLARFLVAEGARVLVNDARPAEALADRLAALDGLTVEYALGSHPFAPTLDADLLFVSPGVPPELPLLVEARRRGIPISSSIRLLFERCPAPIVGITGSSGKTTTTTLVGKIFERAGRHTLVGGNIGVPLLGRLGEIRPDSWVVLELSSFQLEPLDVSPHVAAITNITPNHLDRHPSMEAYTAAKAQIVAHQHHDDWAVLNADDPGSSGLRPPGKVIRFSLRQKVNGAYLDGDVLVLDRDGRHETICRRRDLQAPGLHNVANVLTACAIADAAGIDVEAMRTAATAFTGVRHRLETIAEIDGVRYVNDSIATAPERSMAGLAVYEGTPVVLLAGGRDKHLPMETWAEQIVGTAREVVTFGEMAELVERAVRAAGLPSQQIHAAGTVDRAVEIARRVARPGDVVLLSPGGTSYDQYNDFEERGDHFAAVVRASAKGRNG